VLKLGCLGCLDLIGLIPQAAGTHREGKPPEVLWATDLGPDAETVGERAVSLALDLGAKVVLLHVTPKLSSLMRAYGERPELETMQGDFTDYALGRLYDLAKKLLEGVCDYEVVGHVGDPATVIIEMAELRDPEYLVIGTPRPPERRIKGLGSVGEKVVGNVGVPIVTVPRASSRPRRAHAARQAPSEAASRARRDEAASCTHSCALDLTSLRARPDTSRCCSR